MPTPAKVSPNEVRPSRLRAHTRALLIDAALALFGRKSLHLPAIHQIAAQAGVATGTFYNYFRTREELLEAAMVERAQRLQDEIGASDAHVRDPAERVAIGSRRFVLQAKREPMWAAGLLRLWSSTPDLLTDMLAPVLADLRAGRRRGRFKYRSEGAAVDLLVGAAAAGMRRVLDDRAGEEHGATVAALILRALGISAAEADRIVCRPLPRPPASGAPRT